jgi:lipopolysaccharide assembly protein A
VRAVYWTGVFIIAALVSLFAASNRETVSLGLWPLPFLAETPLYLVVLVALFFGFAAGAMAAWIRGRHRRRQLRACQRQNKALARELAVAQAESGRAEQTVRPALPPTR